MKQKKTILLAAILCIVGGVKMMADPISNVSQLSNTKAYTVVTARGAWCAGLSEMSFSSGITNPDDVPNDASYKFAILKQGDNFFLYSLGAGKFVQPQKNFVTIMPTPITITSLGNAKFKMTSSNPNKAINIGGGQWTWDNWTTTDEGNTLTITEVDDFDATAALAMFETKVYTVSCGRGDWAVTTDHSALTGAGNTNASSEARDKQFALFTHEGKMYLYSVGAEKFVKSDGTLFDGKGDPITFNLTSDATYPYHFYFPLSSQIYFNMQENASSIIFNNWSGQDEGSKYQIESVASADVAAITAKATEVFYGSQTITYTIKINDETVATETREQKVSETASLSSTYTNKEYVTYSYSPSTIAVGTTDVVVTATVDALPFEVSSDFANAHWYNLKIGPNQRYVGWEESEPYHTYTAEEATDIIRASAAYQWAFMGNPVSGIKVVNKHTGENYSLTSEGTGTDVTGAENIPNTVLRSGNFYWDVHENVTGFSLNLIGKNNYYINTHGAATGYFQIWQNGNARTDGGSRMTVEAVPDLATTVTYNVNFNGNKVFTTGVPGVIGTKLETMPANINRDYVTITGFDEETVITRDMEVELTATWNGPFEISTDYANAHWYDMAVRGDYYVTSDRVDGNNALAPIEANAMGLAEDAYQWAFVGDPWHIKIYNKAKGDGQVYAWTETGNGSIPTFVDAATGNIWQIKASNSSISNSFMLTIPDYGYQVNQFGGSSGSLKIWADTRLTDVGSAFVAFTVPTDFHEYAVAEIQPYAAPTGYFALKDAIRSSIGWQDSYATECPFATYKSMKEALEAIDLTDLSNFNLPETGYYILKNKNYGTYMGIDPSDKNMYGNYANANAAKNIVKLTKSGNMYSIGIEGVYAPATVAQSAQVTASTDATNYTVVVPAVGYAAFQADPTADMSVLHCAGGGGIVGWEAPANASQWEVVDATTITIDLNTVDGKSYATFCAPFDVTIGDGATANTVALNGDQTKAAYTAVTDNKVPAGAGVLIISDGAAASVVATINNTGTAFDALTDNELIGYNRQDEVAFTYNTSANGTWNLVLGVAEGAGIGFYKMGSATASPNKAYLPYTYTVGSGVKGFSLVAAADETGIRVIDNGQMTMDNATIYNLAGQRMNKAQKGLYIINGKKMLVK